MRGLEYYIGQRQVSLPTQTIKLNRRPLGPPPPCQRALKRFTPQVDLAKVSWTVHRSPSNGLKASGVTDG